MFQPKFFVLTPGRMILLSFLATICAGVALLSLPWAQKVELSLLDLIFTAVSATCVTGLLTIPLESFTLFGQSVILVLIQIGGLGLITLSVFLISFFIEVGIATHFMAGQVLDLDGPHYVRRLITFIVSTTIGIELVGALITWLIMPAGYTHGHPIFYSIFHSISSFCNAGFTIFPFEAPIFRNNISLLLVTAALVTLGGFGFVALREIIKHFNTSHDEQRRLRLSLHTKIIITTTISITVAGFMLLWLLEHRYAFAHASPLAKIVNVFFDATCARSAGFTTLDMSFIRLPTLFIIILISFIGSSPGSTGSGIKTTTFAIFLATIRAVISGKMIVELKQRRIPTDQVFKALAVLSLSLTCVSIGLLVLLVTEEGWHFSDIMFESFSAFTNLGMSTGITPYLSNTGKFVIMILMLVGRVGSLTLILALTRGKETPIDFRYPEERIALT